MLGCSPGFAAIALVQVQTAANVFAVSNAVTFASPVSAGDFVGVQIVNYYGGGQCAPGPSSVTDSSSDTATELGTWVSSTGNYCTGVYYFVVSAGSSSFSITVNFASSSNIALIGFDYSGVSTTSPIDGSPSGWSSGTGTSATTTALTPAQTGDQQLAFVIAGNTVTYSGWSGSLASRATVVGNGPIGALADASIATGAVTASVTLNTSLPWSMQQVLLHPAVTTSSCTHDGYSSGGAFAVPNGTSGSYWLKNGTFGTPNCSSVDYWQPTVGNFNTN